MSLFDASQIILVTGASSGIGAACALECLAQGAAVIASGRRKEKLDQTGKESCVPSNWHSEPFNLVSGIREIPLWIESIRKKYGKLYGLVHAAGEGTIDSIAGIDLKAAYSHFNINFFAPLMLAKSFSDRRNCAKKASMIFISSIAGIYPEKGHVLYGSAKAALATAIKAISHELAPRGIRANCISPALIQTPLLDKALATMGSQYLENERARYPLGFGQPVDVASLASFLLSSRSEWITGQNFIMDGGAY